MLASFQKMSLRTDFLIFKKHAKKLTLNNLLVYYSSSSNSSRLSIIIPKKVNKLATTRNWLKRLTYDTLWPLIKDQNLAVVVIYKPLLLIKSSQIKETIVAQLYKLKFN